MEHSKQWTLYLKVLLNFIEHSEQWTFYLKPMLNFIEHSVQWTIWSRNIVYIVSSLVYYFSLRKGGVLCMLIGYSVTWFYHVLLPCSEFSVSAVKRTRLCLLVSSRLLFSPNTTVMKKNMVLS